MSSRAAHANVSIEDSGIILLPTAKGLDAEAEGYVVVDCYGNERPFNRAFLTTGILATGIEPPDAFAIALDVHRYLLEHHLTRIDSADLVVLTGDRIADTHSRAKADLYLRWHRARRFGQPLVVALSGTTGIGKSTLATQLVMRLGINQVVSTDSVREVLRAAVENDDSSPLHESLLDAGPNQAALYARQAELVTSACAAIAKRCVRDNKSVLFEGTHLFPGELGKALRAHADNPIVVERMLFIDEADIRSRSDDAEKVRRNAAARTLQRTMREVARLAGVREFGIRDGDGLTLRVVNEYVDRSLD